LDLLTWNLNFRTAEVLEPIRALADRPTVLAFQEVALQQLAPLTSGLLELGYTVFDSCDPAATEKHYGNIVAVAAGVPASKVATQGFPWPQLVLHARLQTEAGPLSVVSVHIPDASNNGWRKIEALEALRATVLRYVSEPLVIAGDFNEPQFALQDGRIVTFAQEFEQGRYETWDSWTYDGLTGSGERWDSAVRWFFERPEESGLCSAYWLSHGQGDMEASHLNHGADRWFDHIFVSRQFAVDSCDYLHEWRTDGYSDHSPLRVALTKVV
jgi:endonuclease/exonuclease/phosphatase family metal-dependent hydrolase